MTGYYETLSAVVLLGTWVIGLHFFKFWRRTRDRLFLMFGAAFWLLTIERVALAVRDNPGSEDHSLIYLIRLAAFLLILYAIIDKNRKESKSRS